VNLGYPRPVAEKTLAGVMKGGNGASFDAIFRQALAALSK